MSERRGFICRPLLVVSNVWFPGVALVRIGRPVAGIALAIVPVAVVMILKLTPFAFATYTFWSLMPILIGAFLLGLTAIIVAMVWTWRACAVRTAPRSISRWPSVVVVALGGTVLLIAAMALPQSYRLFYVPSESSLPTLRPNDHIVVRTHGLTPLHRGDTIVLREGNTEYVRRVAALDGDRIGLHGGLVILNEVAVAQTVVVWGPRENGVPTRRMREQFPGERRPHEVLDAGLSVRDDFAPVTIPKGKLFVVGDNRDRSPDSRSDAQEPGIGITNQQDVVGKVDFIYWSDDHSRVGRPVH